jgi:hypothetical protein
MTTCATRRYFAETNASQMMRSLYGGSPSSHECRHRAPPWPSIKADDWCGDYEAKPPPPERSKLKLIEPGDA